MDQKDIIKLDGMNCYILVDELINDSRYLYVSELEDDDITENFYLYKEQGPGNYIKITDSEELKDVLPKIMVLCQMKIAKLEENE